MKRTLTAALAALALMAGAQAVEPVAPAHHGDRADTRLAEGVVRKVDRAAGKITLAHGPLPNGMPGMTMTFRTADASWLDGISEGRKVRFALDDTMTIVRLETVK